MSFDYDWLLYDVKRGFFKVGLKGKEYGWYGIHVEWKVFEGAHNRGVQIIKINERSK